VSKRPALLHIGNNKEALEQAVSQLLRLMIA
jgi:hypothetical protein